MLDSLDFEPFPHCELCLNGKMAKQPFPSKGNQASKPLELVHIDACGPVNVQAWEGYEYFTTFIDDYSRYSYGYQCDISMNRLTSSRVLDWGWETIR